MKFGLRIGFHRTQKPSSGWVRPAKKPLGGKVWRVGGFRARAHWTGKRKDRMVGGPRSFRWKGSGGPRLRAVGPAGQNADSWSGPRAAKPLCGAVRRGRDLRVALFTGLGHAEAEKPTGLSCFRAAGLMGRGSSGRRINGRNA